MSALKPLVAAILLFIVHQEFRACDVCGANSSMLGTGPMALIQNRAISWSAGFLKMQSTENAVNKYADIFIGSEFGLRYGIGKRQKLLLLANLGYGLNMRSNDSLAHHHGMGDPRIGLAYNLLDRSKDSLNRLRVQGSIIGTLPFGSYDPLIHDRNLPEYFNTGRGAFGFGYALALLKIHDKFFLSGSTLFQHFLASKNGGFRFGSIFNAQLIMGKTFGKNVKLSPYFGGRIENIAQSHFANGNPVPSSQGKGIFSQLGLLVNQKRFMANANAGIPLIAEYAERTVKPSFQIQIEFNYRF